MKALLAAVFVITLGNATSNAQQTGGTCSGHLAGCQKYCQGVRNVSGCQASCNNLYNTCMQTGSWQKLDGTTVSNIQRQ